LPPTPAGFAVQVTTDGKTYTFSIKDTLDKPDAVTSSGGRLTSRDGTAHLVGPGV
jgi:hypothetical protein